MCVSVHVLAGAYTMHTQMYVYTGIDCVQPETRETGKSVFSRRAVGLFAVYILHVSDFIVYFNILFYFLYL